MKKKKKIRRIDGWKEIESYFEKKRGIVSMREMVSSKFGYS